MQQQQRVSLNFDEAKKYFPSGGPFGDGFGAYTYPSVSVINVEADQRWVWRCGFAWDTPGQYRTEVVNGVWINGAKAADVTVDGSGPTDIP